jgi:DNA repair protein RecN (Recombination protein N)
VLTGETGAGKSIVIDALLLITGARAQPDLIRTGADAATVEAVFDLAPDDPAQALLDAAGLASDERQVVVRRELARSGRHRAFVNDSPVTLALLQRLGASLIELHGQHEHQQLADVARQLDLLDRFAGAEDQRARVAAAAAEWDEAAARLEALRAEAREQARQEDLWRFQAQEIDAVAPRDGEEEELRAERRRLAHAERLAEALQEASHILYDDPDAAVARTARAIHLLRDLVAVDAEFGRPADELESARLHLEDAVERVRALRRLAETDPARLEAVEARLDAMTRLTRKYGSSLAEVRAYREEIGGRLDRLARHDEIAAQLEAALTGLRATAERHGVDLGARREEGAARLERQVQKEIRGLGMDHGRFRAALRRAPAAPGELSGGTGGWRIGPRGMETAEFLFSANPGEELRPLAKVASGGELSRTALAVKVVLAAADDTPVLVFDEVDAGIGGRVAEVVGAKLAATARGRQVLCVTHLAPIAAHADHHVLVAKRVARGATRTTARLLEGADRIEELARMLGGERITETTRRHARELYAGARPAAR